MKIAFKLSSVLASNTIIFFRILILSLLIVTGFHKLSLAAEYTFKSKLDVFSVDVTDSGATYNGESVSLEPFEFISPLFKAEFSGPCEIKAQPDLTITRKIADTMTKRIVHIEQKIIGDGKNCGSISGHGIFQLPLHHNWFDGKNNLKIDLDQEFSIWKDDHPVIQFEKKNGKWLNKDSTFATNWTFFEKFISVMSGFDVDFRIHPAAAKESTQFQLRQGERTFNFYKVGEKTWAVEFPGVPWLAASGQFGIFENMDQQIWISPHAQVLKIINDKSADKNTRIKAVRSLYDSTSPDIRLTFREVLVSQDNIDVKKEVVSLLRRRPSDENFSALVSALSVTEDIELQNYISKALRVRNPNGSIIDLDDADEIVSKKILEWKNWAKKLN